MEMASINELLEMVTPLIKRRDTLMRNYSLLYHVTGPLELVKMRHKMIHKIKSTIDFI
jgi:hypothetical protein